MRMLVVGAGSTGGYFGGRLAQAGRDVSFLVRSARAEALRRDGLRIISPHGDATIRPKLVFAREIAAPYDVVLLAVKAYALEPALDDLAPAVGAETMIVPVLNGMRHMEAMAARFSPANVIGGVCKVSTALDKDGRILQLAPFQELSYGEIDGSASARTERLDRALQGAGFEARLSSAIMREMWEKWILLATLGGVTSLMRGSIGEIMAAPGGEDFVRKFLGETVAIARATGAAPSEAFLRYADGMLLEKGSALTSSMYRDLTEGSPIEADQIVGDLLARGRAAGVAAPLLAAAYVNLSVYENRRAAR